MITPLHRTALLSAALLATAASAQTISFPAPRSAEPFVSRVLTTGLEMPWEITLGPDNALWVTERTGQRITRVNTTSGQKTVAVTIPNVLTGPQHEGVLGMALHPDLLKGKGTDYVYVAYTYDADPGTAVLRKTRLSRYTYNQNSQTLNNATEVIANIPAGNDHNAGRLKFGPDGKLYYTTGEQGNNQFGNFRNPIRAQDLPTAAQIAAKDWSTYSGKVLRLNADGSVPSDNPVISGVRSHIYTYGHRNPQGIAFGRNGVLYNAEQGPNSDDEVNVLQAGGNYGWPHVAGYRDNQAYAYANWSAAPDIAKLEYTPFNVPASVPVTKETDWNAPNFVEPVKTFWTVPNTHNFQDPACGENVYICWPTIAPSSIEVYEPSFTGIPSWSNSLLVTSLKNGALYRLRMTADGKSVRGDVEKLFTSENRYRDLAISTNQKTIYIATDSGLTTSSLTGGVTTKVANPGAIITFTYVGK